jgi:hypothetical protein
LKTDLKAKEDFAVILKPCGRAMQHQGEFQDLKTLHGEKRFTGGENAPVFAARRVCRFAAANAIGDEHHRFNRRQTQTSDLFTYAG